MTASKVGTETHIGEKPIPFLGRVKIGFAFIYARKGEYIRSIYFCHIYACLGSPYETFPRTDNPTIVSRLYSGGYREINIFTFHQVNAKIEMWYFSKFISFGVLSRREGEVVAE